MLSGRKLFNRSLIFTTAKAYSLPTPSCGLQGWLLNLVRGGNTQILDAQDSRILPHPPNSVPQQTRISLQ